MDELQEPLRKTVLCTPLVETLQESPERHVVVGLPRIQRPQIAAQRVRTHPPVEFAVVRDGHGPRLFGDDNDDRVVRLAQPHRRLMARPQPLQIRALPLRQRKNAPGRHNVLAPDDHPAVMQRRGRIKERLEEFRNQRSLDPHARFHKHVEILRPLDGDQGANPPLRELVHHFVEFFRHTLRLHVPHGLPRQRAEKRLFPENGQSPAKFRMKNDDHPEGEVQRQPAKQPAEHIKLEDADGCENHENHDSQSHQDGCGPRPADEAQHVIEHRSQNGDLQNIPEFDLERCQHFTACLSPGATETRTRNASTVSRTS